VEMVCGDGARTAGLVIAGFIHQQRPSAAHVELSLPFNLHVLVVP